MSTQAVFESAIQNLPKSSTGADLEVGVYLLRRLEELGVKVCLSVCCEICVCCNVPILSHFLVSRETSTSDSWFVKHIIYIVLGALTHHLQDLVEDYPGIEWVGNW